MQNQENQKAELNEQYGKYAPDEVGHLPAIISGDDPAALMEAFTNGHSLFFSTIQNDGSRETQVKIYNAISDAAQLRDCVKQPIAMTDYMAHPVELVDEETGEIVNEIRVIIVDKDGKSYAAVSKGVKSSIDRLRAIFGDAPWNPPLWIWAEEKVVRSSATNRVLTIKALSEAEVKKHS